MLDQSFSAQNYEIIFNLANRKGQIKLADMPTEYQIFVKDIKDLKRQRTEIEKKKHSDWSTEDISRREDIINSIHEKTHQKQECLCKYITELSHKTNTSSFRFQLVKHLDYDTGKQVFQIKDDSTHIAFFAIKQLQYNIQKIFKVQQANRHAILSNIKLLLNTRLPIYIIRTDISNFYESIPQNRLIKCITDNTLLSPRSISYIKGIINEFNTETNQNITTGVGIPRGVAISPLLSEIYMRDIDFQLKNRQEVIFYARYVDDIFIILSSLNKLTLDKYYNQIQELFKKYGLTLHNTSGKCELIDLFRNNQNISKTLTYLGYTLTICKTGKDTITTFSMSNKKIEKIKKRIDNAFLVFEEDSKYNLKQARHFLLDSLKYITGNYRLKGAKSGVKIGLFYNNDLLDTTDELDKLTEYLHNQPINPSPDKFQSLEERENFIRRLEKVIHKINFKDNWNNKIMYALNSESLQKILQKI